MAVKLKELSEMLGLSPTTVSRAINGYPEVSEDTRARVLEAVKATGYKANQAARRLALGAPRLLGLVLPVEKAAFGSLVEILPSLSDRFALHGYRIVLLPPLRDKNIANFYRHALNLDIEGMVWAQPNKETQMLIRTERSLISTVIVDLDGNIPADFAGMTIDHANAAAAAGKFLLQLGHRHVRLIVDPREPGRNAMISEGMEQALDAFGHRGASYSVGILCDLQAGNSRPYALEGGAWPTALVCSNMAIFKAARDAALKRGLVVGRDVSIIGQQANEFGLGADDEML
ncbi:LacI family DNA-binding transcriptional regulator [Brucella sp. NBRC 113783]|uniref:LacI family DNA-binding transcriptional regulator n=1 Tax=Brucella sp. NBRC 113783 TaxID=3075478 RepID=UPI0029C075F5|nr:LacI family DNA-binding transcriptional regulator [Brucella sp. NBRC 113783]MDX4075589.1 LacI family DNA-binding transcriptional regulator [Brucella sp. NBRC 113783]